jgi:serine protease SohB
MHFLSEFGLFLAKAITLVIAILVIAGGIFWIASKTRKKEKAGKLTIQNMNDKYKDYEETVNHITQTKFEKKLYKKAQKKAHSQSDHKTSRNRLFVVDFQGDIKASSVNALREEITAIILSKKPDDEVLLCVDSPGGMVNAYGLAAAQIQRLKDEKIKLTISVDKMAASGGYMMACVADRIIAAPFAIVGSIGVIAQLPNFHQWLKKKDIQFEQIYAGQFKRTLTLFGENTPEGRQKLQEEINDAHELFKAFIEKYRPNVNINQVATGEHWFATQALALNLLDEIMTSDSFLLAAKATHDIYQVKYELKKTFAQRISATANMLVNKFWRMQQASY